MPVVVEAIRLPGVFELCQAWAWGVGVGRGRVKVRVGQKWVIKYWQRGKEREPGRHIGDHWATCLPRLSVLDWKSCQQKGGWPSCVGPKRAYAYTPGASATTAAAGAPAAPAALRCAFSRLVSASVGWVCSAGEGEGGGGGEYGSWGKDVVVEWCVVGDDACVGRASGLASTGSAGCVWAHLRPWRSARGLRR